MNRKRILVLATLVILVSLFVFVFRSREVNHLLDLSSSNIEKIEIFNPTVSCTITEQDDIKAVIQPLKEMKVRKKIIFNKDGYTFSFTITYKTGKEITMALLENELLLNRHVYTLDKSYIDTYWEIIDKLKVK